MFHLFKSVVFGYEKDDEEEKARTVPSYVEEKRSFTGQVTSVDGMCGMVDYNVFFDHAAVVGGQMPSEGDMVNVEAVREHSEAGWRAVSVHLVTRWYTGTTEEPENSAQRSLVGYVKDGGRGRWMAVCGNEEVVFDWTAADTKYLPHRGDWVMLKVEEEGEVTSIQPLREQTVIGRVDRFTGVQGIVDGSIGFSLAVCESGYYPQVGDEVKVVCVECKHPHLSWRAVNLSHAPAERMESGQTPNIQCLPVEVETQERNGVLLTSLVDFGEVEIGKTFRLPLLVRNSSEVDHVLISCTPVTYADQITIAPTSPPSSSSSPPPASSSPPPASSSPPPASSSSYRDDGSTLSTIPAGEDTSLIVEITPRSLGRVSTALVLTFSQFRMVCTLKASVVDDAVRKMEPTHAYRPLHRIQSAIGPSYQAKVKARILPGQRPTRNRLLKLSHRLKHYPVSEELRECLLLKEDITFVRPNLDDPLSWEGYHDRWSTLLHCTEVTMEEGIRQFDMQSVSMQRCGPFLAIVVPGLAEGRPSLIVGDSVLVCEPGGDGKSEHFEGYVHEVRQSDILVKFADKFHDYYRGEDYDVMFTFNRMPLRRMHYAVENAGLLGKKVLFPVNPNPLPPLLHQSSSSSTFFNSCLNERQRSAVVRILAAQCRPAPYILFGPPGTGKTVTVVESILQVYHLSGRSCRVLACAPSNSAADLLAERLLLSGHLEQGALIRLNALQRSQPPSALLLPHCLDVDSADTAAHYRVVVCTCVTAGLLYSLGLSVGHFTHVFVDEAGQATEPECLIPLGLLAGTDRQAVLSGDPLQLGPIIQSLVATLYGMEVSLLERMMGRDAYQRDKNRFADHGNYDPLLVTKLVENYRSHKSLLALYSDMFYDGELLPAADPALTHSLCHWDQLPRTEFPLMFLGVLGEDMREGSSPSWFNPVEAVEVVKIAQSLLGGHAPLLTIDEVGIITPYHKQVEKIRLLLRRTGLEDIKVGSVEEFQGQERKAIILSTVRSAPDMVHLDQQHHLGFLRNPKRFNVSISRAQALLVVVGNPNLLSLDPCWSELLQYAVKNAAYCGVPLSHAPTSDVTS